MARTLGLVVTGHPMNGIPGPDFVAELRRRMPLIPVLVVSETAGFQKEYPGIDGVFFAIAPTADELRRLAHQLLAGEGQRKTA